MTRVLLTGANGFIGRPLFERLLDDGFQTNMAVRSISVLDKTPSSVCTLVGEIDAVTPWDQALANIEVVIHLAARVHITNENAADSLAEFRKVNVDGTVNLARQAARMGVRRFIFISSIKVNGENTEIGRPFTAEDAPAPTDAYGISKREAEDALRVLSTETGMEVVIIRPPIVYGPGVKANFQTLMRCLAKGIPLPFGAINNQRSLVALDNLVDLILTCIHHPNAANQTFLVSDGEDISTTRLLLLLAAALGKKAYLLPIPERVIRKIALLIGKKQMLQKLCGSLQVDISKTLDLLNWKPPIKIEQALLKTALAFKDNR